MLLSAQFVILQLINKCVGLAPITTGEKNKKIIKSIPIILTLFLSACIFTYLLNNPIFESSGAIHGLINFASLLSVWLTIISGNIQCIVYSSAYQRINDQIRCIEEHYKNRFSRQFTINLSRQYRRKVCLIFCLFFVSQGILFYEVRLVSGMDRSMWSSFLTSMLRSIFPLSVSHIVLYTDTIGMLTKEICLTLDNSSVFSYPSNKFELLKNIKIMHMDLFKLVVQVNLYFGWNLLCVLLKLFVYITLLFYWIFIAINNEIDVMGLIEASVSLLYGMSCLFILTNSCQLCSKEAIRLNKRMEQFVFLSTDDMQLYNLKRDICNQINHHPMIIVAADFFNIDRDLVSKLFAGCCMYNIIFIQFFLAVEKKGQNIQRND